MGDGHRARVLVSETDRHIGDAEDGRRVAHNPTTVDVGGLNQVLPALDGRQTSGRGVRAVRIG